MWRFGSHESCIIGEYYRPSLNMDRMASKTYRAWLENTVFVDRVADNTTRSYLSNSNSNVHVICTHLVYAMYMVFAVHGCIIMLHFTHTLSIIFT